MNRVEPAQAKIKPSTTLLDAHVSHHFAGTDLMTLRRFVHAVALIFPTQIFPRTPCTLA